ncbi:hypothetical protein SAMN05216188_13156 [Lentzea xinjiangensis]|uniref:Uncharacterized protein n=1 Tax=Lentzea xinjiangensis TaxID=402600 RepID=A0A1H9W9S0_9PSEU|nr:hypothetical protein [Lentzea xinjiangensis]SES30223.1 hypothetical protein SAMN05216188_13156 [Lentzea xinjiangensis]
MSAALLPFRIGGTEVHVISTIVTGIDPPESFGRIHRLPKELPAVVMVCLRERGFADAEGRFTDAGRELHHRVEALTDDLAALPYDALSCEELDDLVAQLGPIAAKLVAR